MCQLLLEFSDAFSKGDNDLGEYRGVEHEILLTDDKPIKHPLRRTPIHFQEEEEAHLELLQELDVIRPSTSPYCSSPVLVRKKDGGVRWCLDYRDLNNITQKDVFPLPKISECIDKLAGNRLYSCIDLAMGYFQIPVKPEHRKYTAFNTRFGLFEHNRMSFGLCNAPATFQRAMNEVLRGLLWTNVLCYLDDCIVMGKNFDHMLTNLREVFQRFHANNLKMKAKKCDFFKKEVKFLGWVVNQEGVRPDPAKVRAVQDWPRPETIKQLQGFLGLANYHRTHMPDFAGIADPLYRLTKKGAKKLVWNDDAEKAFRALKDCLTKAPVLGFPDPNKVFVLDTDASDVCVGCELSQMDEDADGRLKEETAVVIEYGSASLDERERRYCVTRRELLAVVYFTRQYRHYLLGKRFLVRTDHNALRWLFTFKSPGDQLARWLEELSQFDMDILYRKGEKHVNADALSRRPDDYPFCERITRDGELGDLPCMQGEQPCRHCSAKEAKWKRYREDVDYVVPLSFRSGEFAVRSLSIDLAGLDAEVSTETCEDTGMISLEPRICYLSRLLEGSSEDGFGGDDVRMITIEAEPLIRYLDSDLDATLPYSQGRPNDSPSDSQQGAMGASLDNTVQVTPVDTTDLDATLPYGGGVPAGVASGDGNRRLGSGDSDNFVTVLSDSDVDDDDDSDQELPHVSDWPLWHEIDDEADEPEQVKIQWESTFKLGDLVTEQAKDKDVRIVKEWLSHNPSQAELSNQSKDMKLLWRRRDLLVVRDGVLYMKLFSYSGDRLVLVVPYQLRDVALRTCHEALYAGHFGVEKTLSLLKQSFFWPSMAVDAELFVGSCGQCNRNKKIRRTPRSLLSTFHAGYPLERVHIDLVGKLEKTPSGNQWILVAVDQFTKFVEAFPLADASAETIAETLVTRFFTWLGYPLYIHSDQGANFTGKVFSAVCKLVEVHKTQTTAYRPCSNGQVERYNRTLIEQIRCLKDSRNMKWDQLCPFVTQNMRGTPNDRTGITPNMLMFGREVLGPRDLLFGLPTPEPQFPGSEYVRQLRDRMKVASDVHAEKLGKARVRWKSDYDTRANPVPYAVGDFVYLVNTTPVPGRGMKKLRALYKGPFIVLEVKSLSVLRVADRKKEYIVGHDRLIPCNDRDIPLWIKRMRDGLHRVPRVVQVSPPGRSSEPPASTAVSLGTAAVSSQTDSSQVSDSGVNSKQQPTDPPQVVPTAKEQPVSAGAGEVKRTRSGRVVRPPRTVSL